LPWNDNYVFTLWAFAFFACVDLGNTEFPATVFALAIDITDAAYIATIVHLVFPFVSFHYRQ
jgi:hypothetical protein